MKTIKQTGFSIVEALIVVAAIAVLVSAGWAVYQRTKQSATRTDAASNPSQSTQQTTKTPPAPTVTYLDIQEWGIKLQLSDTIKDAYYLPDSQNHAADGTPLAMFIGLKSLDAAGCDARTANTPGGTNHALGTLIRIAPTDVDHVSGVEYVKEWPSATIGNYAYAFDDGTKYRTCASTSTLQSIGAAFSNATKNATPSTSN